MNTDYSSQTTAEPSAAARHFTAFRLIFGGYLALHFAALLPWAEELFGYHGLIGNPALNPTAGLFPNPFNAPLSGTTLKWIFAALTGLSLMFAAGWWRPVVSGVLWFFWTALFHRNNLISNPSIPCVGLLLALCALIPSGEPWCLSCHRGGGEDNRKLIPWTMPPWVMRTVWILLATGYTFSALTKLPSPSWRDGDAMRYLLANPLARPGPVRDLMLHLPSGALKLMTWGTLFLELAFAPLAWWKKSRPWVWAAMVGLHAGILLVLDFADLSFGMLMIHAFTFDPAWLRELARWTAKWRPGKRFRSRALTGANAAVLVALPALLLNSCSTVSPHSGLFPFKLSERPPRHREGSGMTIALKHDAASGVPDPAVLRAIQPGDVIAFHMSHREAWAWLRQGSIQKLPYELFRYGHIALVVPEPDQPWQSGHFRLLQIAMKQAANAEAQPEYLTGKSWVVYRPPAGSVDVSRLREFTAAVTISAGDPKKAYDYPGTLGLKNAPWLADHPAEIGHQFTCATLVAGGLHYAGYSLDAVHRRGWLDIVTPRQLVESGAVMPPR